MTWSSQLIIHYFRGPDGRRKHRGAAVVLTVALFVACFFLSAAAASVGIPGTLGESP